MTAYAGTTGQHKYELTLHFGNRTLSKYARRLDIGECIPKSGNKNWFTIDTEKFQIGIQLL